MNINIIVIILTYIIAMMCGFFGLVVIKGLLGFLLLGEILYFISSIIRKKFDDKWNKLTPEQKDAFNEKMRNRNEMIQEANRLQSIRDKKRNDQIYEARKLEEKRNVARKMAEYYRDFYD